MSYESEVAYRIAAQARRLANMQRVRATTQNFLNRYRGMLNDFLRDRLDNFIPDEIEHLKSQLNEAENFLTDDPFTAREVSQSIQTYIHGLRHIARENQHQQEQAEKERVRREQEEREVQKSAAMSAYYAAVRKISGAAVQNFAREELSEIRKDIEAGRLVSEFAIESRVDKAKANAAAKATQWKQQTAEKAQKEGLGSQIAEMKEQISSQSMDASAKQKALASLDDLLGRTNVETSSAAEIQNSIKEIDKAIEEEVVSEESRKIAVQAIVKSLRSHGFEISAADVTLVEKDGHNVVRIVGNKANGRHAEVDVTDQGKMIRRFEKYEGMSCMKDVDALTADLDKIYSIKLSDERVLWQNPDRIGKDANDLPTSNSNWRNQ